MEFGGYAVDADLASVLRSHVRHGGHRSIVEFGAGLSTLTMSLALAELGVEGSIVSFEASRGFADQVTSMLGDAGLSARARVVHAPLGSHVVNGREVRWHDPEVICRAVPDHVDLLFIDGPVSVDSWSRWPAVELLWRRLGRDSVILLDDSRRRREHQCAVRWAATHPELQLSWIDTLAGAWRAEVGAAARERGMSGCMHAVLRTVNPRPAGWGKWPVRRM
jgi:predicted O-methyltransferase YrrM